MARIRQEWCCEECGVNGSVMIDQHESVYAALYKIKDSHALKSPECRNSNLTDIRVRYRKLCNPGEWGGVCKAARIESLKRKFIVNELKFGD